MLKLPVVGNIVRATGIIAAIPANMSVALAAVQPATVRTCTDVSALGRDEADAAAQAALVPDQVADTLVFSRSAASLVSAYVVHPGEVVAPSGSSPLTKS